MITVMDAYDPVFNASYPFQKDTCRVCSSLGVKYRVIISPPPSVNNSPLYIDMSICENESCLTMVRLNFAECL